MARCRDCDASIRFLRMPSGSRMPINIDPHPQGNIVVTDDLLDHGRVLGKHEAFIGNRYRPHWMTCPHAAAFRRKRRTA